MNDNIRTAVRAIVDRAPPLKPDQVAKLRVIISNVLDREVDHGEVFTPWES